MASNKSEKRDWLILSLKWSKDDLIKWYATASAGYTSSLIRAGRYTEAEAVGEMKRCPEHCLAVHLDDLIGFTEPDVVMRNDGRTVERLKRVAGRIASAEAVPA